MTVVFTVARFMIRPEFMNLILSGGAPLIALVGLVALIVTASFSVAAGIEWSEGEGRKAAKRCPKC